MNQKSASAELFKSSINPSTKKQIQSISEKDIGNWDSFITITKSTPYIFQKLGKADLPVKKYLTSFYKRLLIYENDKEKAVELPIMLRLQITGNSTAYINNVIHKSDLV